MGQEGFARFAGAVKGGSGAVTLFRTAFIFPFISKQFLAFLALFL